MFYSIPDLYCSVRTKKKTWKQLCIPSEKRFFGKYFIHQWNTFQNLTLKFFLADVFLKIFFDRKLKKVFYATSQLRNSNSKNWKYVRTNSVKIKNSDKFYCQFLHFTSWIWMHSLWFTKVLFPNIQISWVSWNKKCFMFLEQRWWDRKLK